ncbi:MAG TPA: hypothetical protein VGS11_11835 [Candidatus Bathyarchaeia archaeon]|nr:hypothetical protein [Candidatus Bathyarchaeia archaeon]
MKVGQKEITVTQFSTKCPQCGKELTALSEKKLAYSLKLHKKLSHGET